MDYDEWEKAVPAEIRSDSLWKMGVYRLGLFLGELAWDDVTRLTKDRRTIGIADQLYRAIGGISPNIAEGYSRGTGRDRARFYEYALGSAREVRDWYYKSRHVLGEDVFAARLTLIASIIRQLLVMIPQQRTNSSSFVREETIITYDAHGPSSDSADST
jgi:four helix bundle protein